MSRHIASFVLICSWLTTASSADNVGATRAATAGSQSYAPIRAQLRRSAVPVYLPDSLPQAIGPIHSVAVIDVGTGGYYVGFSPIADCGGALSCAFFHVAGSPLTRHTDRSFRHDRVVAFPDGTQAFFRPTDCSGASCTEATLTFERRGAVYEIDAKVSRDALAVLRSAYLTLRLVR